MISQKNKQKQDERDAKIVSRFLKLGEFYTKKERYNEIADQYGISESRVQQIILKAMKGGRK